jgi:hypothetical protein
VSKYDIFKAEDLKDKYLKLIKKENGAWTWEILTYKQYISLLSVTPPDEFIDSKDKDGNKVPIAHTDKIPLFTKHKIYGEDTSPVERAAKIRYGNASEVRLEVRYGSDDSLFKLTHVMIDYIKTP